MEDLGIQTYTNDALGATIRVTVDENGNTEFCGKDAAVALGYANPTKAVRDHCRCDGGPKRYPIIDSLGRTQDAVFITEPDLYRLIVGSKLSSAQKFEAWVFEEVLPSIRRRGGYMVAAADETPEQTMARALLIANDALKKKDARIAELEPKGKAFDACMNGNLWYTFTEASRLLRQTNGEITRTKLFALAIKDNIITVDKQASRYGIDRGYVVDYMPPTRINQRTGEPIPCKPYAKITTKGLRWMFKRYCQEG